jgi:hypothetical protein
MMCSKDNDKYPKYQREFFEKPVAYDVNGSRKLIYHPYGWDLPRVGSYKELIKNASCNKISLINSMAFTNFLSSRHGSVSKAVQCSSESPLPIRGGKTVKYLSDHLLV